MSFKNVPDEKRKELIEYVLLHYSDSSPKEISEKFGVSVNDVSYTVQQMREAGFSIPRRAQWKGKNFFDGFYAELKKKHPNLVKENPVQNAHLANMQDERA